MSADQRSRFPFHETQPLVFMSICFLWPVPSRQPSQSTRRWSVRWRLSVVWSIPTWRSLPRPCVIRSPRRSCIFWSTRWGLVNVWLAHNFCEFWLILKIGSRIVERCLLKPVTAGLMAIAFPVSVSLLLSLFVTPPPPPPPLSLSHSLFLSLSLSPLSPSLSLSLSLSHALFLSLHHH